MNVDPEIKRKAEDLKRPHDPEKRDANEERQHLDEKAGEIIGEAAAKKRTSTDPSSEAEESEGGESPPGD
ncbi:MAG: hypothetical protein ACTHJM_05260 [Marmoricola sp.]